MSHVTCPKCNEAFFFKRCENCIHYDPHYTFREADKRYIKIEMGHCSYPNMKNRKASEYCGNWNGK